MSLKVLGDAVTRFHKLLDGEPFRDLSWADDLKSKMEDHGLVIAGRPVSPVLRPHFITKKQYEHLVKASESLTTAIDRVKRLALAHPQLLSRIALLPAEKMLAQIDPGYTSLAVTSLLDTHIHNGHLQFAHYSAENPAGVAYGDVLADLFLDTAPVKEFKKKYGLSKVGGAKFLLQALTKAYKEYGGKKQPNIAILEFRQPFAGFESGEYQLLVNLFRKAGFRTELITPDNLEYRNGVLRHGDFEIDLIYRRVRIAEFLVRFDLQHPLVKAYREGKVCVVNSFRSDMSQKKALFDLLTDEAVTAKFPVAERKAIRDYIPWTRVVAPTRTTYQGEPVDLLAHIVKNRESLVLKPNDENSDLPAYTGAELDQTSWERAVRRSLTSPYVVQERIAPVTVPFPVRTYAGLEYREMRVEVHPHSYLGKVHGCTSWLSSSSGYSVTGLAPTLILETK
jgi:hypothetical protein